LKEKDFVAFTHYGMRVKKNFMAIPVKMLNKKLAKVPIK